MLSRVFDHHDTTLYASREDDRGIVTLFIPEMGELRMSLAKAEDIAADIARQAEYGRWAAIEKKHDESQEKQSI